MASAPARQRSSRAVSKQGEAGVLIQLAGGQRPTRLLEPASPAGLGGAGLLEEVADFEPALP